MARTVQVELPENLAAEGARAIAAGEFTSEAEAITSAVADWSGMGQINKLSTNSLRKLWGEGIASGPGRNLSIEEIKHEARQRLAKADL